MRAHSIESKRISAKQQHRISNDAPEAYSSVCSFHPKQEKDNRPALRRCQSASALAKMPKQTLNHNTQRLTQLELKYRNLQEDYKKVLEEVRSQTEHFCKQKDQIQKLNKITQRQEREIQRLKQLLKMTEKKSIGFQTDQQSDHQYRKRIEASTGQSELTSQTRCDRPSTRKQSQSKQKQLYTKNTVTLVPEKQNLGDSRMLRTNGTNINCNSNGNISINMKNGSSKVPLAKKYKFIPTLNFRHS